MRDIDSSSVEKSVILYKNHQEDIMKSLSWYLAYRYLSFKKGEYAISTMAIIAFISIAIGSGALALITAIMNGFQVSIHEKMQNIHPQATIYSYKDPIAFDALKKALSKEFPEVIALSPYALSHVMIRSDAMEDDELPIVAALKAIDPTSEALVSSLKQKIKLGKNLSVIKSNQVLLGKAMADTLGVGMGDVITALYIEQPTGKQRKVNIQQKELIVGGIFETGIDEYDSKTVYSSFEIFKSLFPDNGITQVGIAFDPSQTPTTLIPRIKKRIDLEILTWQELYLPLVSALILEKYAMFLILLLITLVASMNIIALLFMIITHKRSDIAILRAMGLSNTIIARSFMLLGLIISAAATISGLFFACVASWILEHYPFIQLPDVYYVSHLPARMEAPIILVVFMLVMAITFIASWFSVRRIHSINIAHVLRFEG